MPKVGDKEFAYTPEGIAAAKAEADMTGESMEIVDAGSRSQSYQLGGKIPGQPGFGEQPLGSTPGQSELVQKPLSPLPGNLATTSDIVDPSEEGQIYKKGGKVKKLEKKQEKMLQKKTDKAYKKVSEDPEYKKRLEDIEYKKGLAETERSMPHLSDSDPARKSYAAAEEAEVMRRRELKEKVKLKLEKKNIIYKHRKKKIKKLKSKGK